MRIQNAIGEVEWPTLVFFAALFVMVGALVETGVIGQISRAADATQGRLALTGMVPLWGSAGISAIVDNIPYVATMSPIVTDLVQAGGEQARVLWWALALGAGPRRQRHRRGGGGQRGHRRHRRP
ncbi:SLC13 family permease [Nonomuraea polychroma]|uniref:SLC13 family permease n=1 Tax=Nonomuraea polychroma TaxID=46176 RepID=UPI003D935D14